MIDIYEGVTRDLYRETRARIHNMCQEKIPVHVGKQVKIHAVDKAHGGWIGTVLDFDDRMVAVAFIHYKRPLLFGREMLVEVDA